MAQQKDYGGKPSALLATDKILHFPAAGDETYADDLQKVIDDVLKPVFALLNGDITEDFAAKNTHINWRVERERCRR